MTTRRSVVDLTYYDRVYGGESFGQRLRRLREARRLSQRDVASQCEGVSYAHVSRLEADHRMASVRVIRELAAALDVTAAYLEYGYERDDELRRLQNRVEELLAQLESATNGSNHA